MALPASIIEVEYSASNANDAVNGGDGFCPLSRARVTDLKTDSSGTGSAALVSSASYAFAAGDVGNWLCVTSGTNWNLGWYKITGVTSGTATLNSALGGAVVYVNSVSTSLPSSMSTVNGVVTASYVSSTASGTWCIDYSQNTAGITLTGTQTALSTTFLCGSATKAMVGNFLQITSGSNQNNGFYFVTAATAGVSLTLTAQTGTNWNSSATARGTGLWAGRLRVWDRRRRFLLPMT